VLVQDEVILVRGNEHFPKDPPLLSTCKQIRVGASSIYGENRLEVQTYNLNITKITDWMRLSPPRVALYKKSELYLSIMSGSAYGKDYGLDCWPNLLVWVDLYFHKRCRRVVAPSTNRGVNGNDKEPDKISTPAFEAAYAVKIFDIVDELLKEDGMTMGKIRKALKPHRLAFLKLD
jgi:hypothetical protein